MTTSLRHIQNGIVIDMRGLNKVRYDEKTEQMTVGGGINTGEFANATHAQGMEVSKYNPGYGRGRLNRSITVCFKVLDHHSRLDFAEDAADWCQSCWLMPLHWRAWSLLGCRYWEVARSVEDDRVSISHKS